MPSANTPTQNEVNTPNLSVRSYATAQPGIGRVAQGISEKQKPYPEIILAVLSLMDTFGLLVSSCFTGLMVQ